MSASGNEVAPMMPFLRRCRLLAVSCTLFSCYSYRNTAVGDAALMTPVRVELTEQGSEEISKQVGPRGSMLEGVLASRSDSSLVFNVTALARMNGVEETWHGEHVTVPATDVSRIQLRKFSAVNTSLLAAAIVLGGYFVRSGAGSRNIVGTPGGPPPGGGGQ